MSDASVNIDRISPTRRPHERAIGHQKWSNLLFVHWRVSPLVLEPLLPPQLTVDTFEGTAWVGLVPFHMSGVRPKWSPAIPGVSSFHETNVRTYVHMNGQDPGVWFFSLDASSSLAVRIARWKWQLPYFRAAMRVKRSGDVVRYESERLWPGAYGAGTSIEAKVEDLLGALDKDVPAGQAVAGTLEHFLAERYILYALGKGNTLNRGQVHHTPYPLREARLLTFEETLLEAAQITPRSGPEHVMFSEGVDVEIFKLRPTGSVGG